MSIWKKTRSLQYCHGKILCYHFFSSKNVYSREHAANIWIIKEKTEWNWLFLYTRWNWTLRAHFTSLRLHGIRLPWIRSNFGTEEVKKIALIYFLWTRSLSAIFGWVHRNRISNRRKHLSPFYHFESKKVYEKSYQNLYHFYHSSNYVATRAQSKWLTFRANYCVDQSKILVFSTEI